MADETEKPDPFEEGRSARRAGKTMYGDNPYFADEHRGRWEAGYMTEDEALRRPAPAKVIQITAIALDGLPYLYALKDDGTMWVRLPVTGLWTRSPGPGEETADGQ